MSVLPVAVPGQLRIAGALVDAADRFAVDDPATGDVLTEVHNGSEDDGRAAVDAAAGALAAWSTKYGLAAWSTKYGLAAYVYTGDLARGLRVSEALDTGMVGLNRGFISDPAAPFGGVKQSGLGREGGHDGLLQYLETKYIAAAW